MPMPKSPSRRQITIACVAADVAENGRVTTIGLRAYIEGRISRQVFDAAIRAGRAIYERGHCPDCNLPYMGEHASPAHHSGMHAETRASARKGD